MDSHTNYQFLEKVKIRGFGCYKHKNVTNLANDDFWNDIFLERSHQTSKAMEVSYFLESQQFWITFPGLERMLEGPKICKNQKPN